MKYEEAQLWNLDNCLVFWWGKWAMLRGPRGHWGQAGVGWYWFYGETLFVGSQSDKNLGKYRLHMDKTHWRFLSISTWLVTSFIFSLFWTFHFEYFEYFFTFLAVGEKRKLRQQIPPRYILGHHRQWKFWKKTKKFWTGIFRAASDLRNASEAEP